MRLIKEDTHFNFLGKWKFASAISGLAILGGLAAYFPLGGLNYGIDFRGGTLVQIQFPAPPDLSQIRATLASSDAGSFSLQSFGGEENHEILVTVAGSDENQSLTTHGLAQRIGDTLSEAFPGLTVRRVESVGPKVGRELKIAAFQAVVFAILAILAYVWIRFQWRYSIAAVVALLHDVFIVLAAFLLTQKEITLPVVAAVLTVAGYSINDTIVILDRIRDNVRKFQKKPLFDILNESLNQTLSRTLLTSGTTLLVVLSIYFFGGEIINDFAFALLIGVLVGTYSSIFVASPLVWGLNNWFPQKIK